MSNANSTAGDGLWSRMRQKAGLRLIAIARRLLGDDHASPSEKQHSKTKKSIPNSEPGSLARSGLIPSTPEPLLDMGGGGRVAYEPINVNATYHNGHLYYPIETLVQVPVLVDGVKSVHEQTEVVVVRSDRTVHRAHASQVPESGSARQQVHRLSDGTLIQRPPKANPHGTWSFESADAYIRGAGDDLDLGGLARSVHQHLYSRIWLPGDEDYWLLTFVAITSYVQSVFDAVPLCLVCGPAGSGKSELGSAVAEVSANAVMIGQTSPATMMRLIDESGGLVVIDDLEAIGSRGNGRKEERFSEIAQVLKVSYKKSTATKVLTDSQSMKTKVLNFFGVKIINNTSGTSGATLGSRMVRVHTRHLPAEEKAEFLARPKIPETELALLRNMLHTWAMSHVEIVRQAYLDAVVDRTMREEEIAAPLRALAILSKDKDAAAALEKALEKEDINELDPSEVLERAVGRLAALGYRSVVLQHVLLEMRQAYASDGSTTPGEWLKIEWIGRRLRQMGITKDQASRKRLHGVHLRVAPLSDNWLAEFVRRKGDLPAKRDPFSFCDRCDKCAYASVHCEISVKRRLSGTR